MNLPVLHGGAPDGRVLGMDWLELGTLVVVLGILVGAVWAWVVGARAQTAARAERAEGAKRVATAVEQERP